MAHNDNDLSQWTSLWRRGYITTFGPSMPDNYGLDVKAYWHKQFDKLDKGAVILDVAAGNGAIATIAAEYSDNRGKDFSIMAADAAEINFDLIKESKSLDAYRDKIKFYSEAPCECLPFEDSSVDLVCSQFGIEYSVLAESLLEVGRVLRDGGSFAAVMHHSMSSVIQEATRECKILENILYEQKVFEILEKFYAAVGEVKDEAALANARQNKEAVASAMELDRVFGYLGGKYSQSPVMNRVRSEVDAMFRVQIYKSEEERKSLLRAVYDDLRMMAVRQNDLQQAAISPLTMQQVKETAEASGLRNFTYSEVKSPDGKKTGWLANAVK
ncbi:class I SAM-dependent methyltransferase [Pseudomonadota bacterium]